jgi:hypothetical protein
MNNVELNQKKDAYAMVTEQTSDPSSEEEIVVQTAEVSRSDYEDGWRMIFATILLYNLRGLYALSSYLHHSGARRYADLFTDFTEFIAAPGASAACRELDRLRRGAFELRTTVTESFGRTIHYLCHEGRDTTDACLAEFVAAQGWWADRRARGLFEADLLNRVHVYAGPRQPPKYAFEELRLRGVNARGYVVEVPEELAAPLRDVFAPRATFGSGVVQVNHRQRQAPLGMMRAGSFEQWGYCAHKMVTIRELMASWDDATGLDAPADIPSAAAVC